MSYPSKTKKPVSRSSGAAKPKSRFIGKPKLELQTTTLWDYPSQHYGEGMQGDKAYVGATPSYIIWNLLQRFTKEGDLVVDPMCGSGTTIDVCKDVKRSVRGFDIAPSRADIEQADARHLPLKSASVDFIFVDPPYSNHVQYSGHINCIGELDARTPDYYAAMEVAITEMARVLKPGAYMGLYVSDSFAKDKAFCPIGFELFARLCRHLDPYDIISVTRHNKTLKRNHWHTSAVEGNYFLRGFNYLFIMRKPPLAAQPVEPAPTGRLTSSLAKGASISPKAIKTQPEIVRPSQKKRKQKQRKRRMRI